MLSNWKNTFVRLDSNWRDMLSARQLTDEVTYRIQKLIVRLDAIGDKIFVSTLKGHEILIECLKITERFKSEQNKPDSALRLLTRLENHMDDLVKKTHDFRIKAG